MSVICCVAASFGFRFFGGSVMDNDSRSTWHLQNLFRYDVSGADRKKDIWI